MMQLKAEFFKIQFKIIQKFESGEIAEKMFQYGFILSMFDTPAKLELYFMKKGHFFQAINQK